MEGLEKSVSGVRTILVVDAYTSTGQLIELVMDEQSLSGLRVEISQAMDGETAISLYHNEKPEVVVIDPVRLPGVEQLNGTFNALTSSVIIYSSPELEAVISSLYRGVHHAKVAKNSNHGAVLAPLLKYSLMGRLPEVLQKAQVDDKGWVTSVPPMPYDS